MGDKNITVNITSGSIIKALAIVAVAVVLFFLKDIFVIVLTAIVISSAVEPGINWFEKRNFPRIIGVVSVYLFALVIVGILFLSIIPVFLQDISGVVTSIPTYLNQISSYFPILDDSFLQGYVPILQNIASSISNTGLLNQTQSSSDFIATATKIINSGLSAILIGVLSFYFSVTKDGVEYFLRIITPLKHEPYVLDLWKRTKIKIGAWLQGQLILGLVVGVMVYIPLAILGIRHALLLAITASILEIIPVFGPTLFAIPGILLTLLDKGIVLALVVTGMYVIVQQFENYLLYPAVVKKIVGISPLIIILALAVGFELLGFLGLILAVPLSVLAVEYLHDVDKKKTRISLG
ncbi:MAG: AI-2E family transporter [Candidatus Paceibacterota bacterium]